MSELYPPRGFIAAAVHLAMMSSTQRDSELIAGLAPERPTLREAQVMGVRRLPAANQARLVSDIPDVVTVTYAAWLRQC